jgi:hypothetical protein
MVGGLPANQLTAGGPNWQPVSRSCRFPRFHTYEQDRYVAFPIAAEFSATPSAEMTSEIT